MRKTARNIVFIIAFALALTLFTGCTLTEFVDDISGAMSDVNVAIGDVRGDVFNSLMPILRDNCKHVWVDADCTQPKTCSICRKTEGEALGHTEVIDEAVAPTCTDDGKTAGTHCSACNEVLVAQETVKAEGHDYKAEVTESTPTAGGYTTYTCEKCGNSYKDDFTDPTGETTN